MYWSITGPAPHARGALQAVSGHGASPGTSPARAGSTLPDQLDYPGTAVLFVTSGESGIFPISAQSPIPESPSLSRFAPTALGRRRSRSRPVGRTVDEREAFVIDWMPGMVMGAEREALFVVCRVREQGSPFARVAAYFLPEQITYAGRGVADEDAGGDLQ